MKLEDQFFRSFFYPFFIGLFLSMVSIIIFSIIYTNDYIDIKTSENLFELEKNNAQINLNTIRMSLSSFLLKIQASANEIILGYQKISKTIKLNPDLARNLNDTYLKCALDLNDTEINEDISKLNYMAYWFLDAGVTKAKLDNYPIVKKQLIAFSNIIPNLFQVFAVTNSSAFGYYFYFESTELYLSFPLFADYIWDFTKILDNYTDNPVWCTDSNGNIYNVYKCKCREFYLNIQKAKTDIFDYNSVDNKNRSIFVTEFYYQSGMDFTNVFTMCVQFDEPISEGKAYICADIGENSLIYNFDNINSKLNGYFLVNPVGFSRAFYFPESIEYAYAPTENIFGVDKNFFLEEKNYFYNHIQKLMTSNYIKYINDKNDFFLDEVFINGQNSFDQYFYFNGEIFNFSIYPVVFENIQGYKEHVLNIIYIYNKEILIKKIRHESNIFVQILLEVIIFAVFGSGLLYLVVLTFNILAKYIVIPIKNADYMMKGINIGGKNRLDYLDFLKKQQDENIEILEKIYMNKDRNDKKSDKNEKDVDNSISNNENKENDLDKEQIINEEKNRENDSPNGENKNNNEEFINSKKDFEIKLEQESEFIEKENNFYDFDENLLQFRPLEIDHLIKSLIELKGASLLTKSDSTVEQIIDYSNSEEIFRNFKNMKGENICESNIGNLQSQLMKYDKAIYHLAISLQDNKLKRFFRKNLYDELDESNNLLYKISKHFNPKKIGDRINPLVEKQQNNSKSMFSQKIIGVLINTRYTRLIYAYYKFFSLLQKSKKELIGQFLNTSFHNINYYHKSIIQYIFLSYVKNDFIKIGESILDYIEFLIKFKLNTSSDNGYLMDIHNYHLPELKEKRKYKRDIFQKIVKWFILFDDYVLHVKNNTQLLENETLIKDISVNMNSSNSQIDIENRSVFLFRVNIQREEYLKGKFAMKCKNYNDALYYLIRASQKKSIAIDGLIKKKSLKKMIKILNILMKQYKKYRIDKLNMEENVLIFETVQAGHISRRNNKFDKNENNNINDRNQKTLTFQQEIEFVKDIIKNEFNECCIKKAKDIIIIIDFNVYNNEQNSYNDKIEAYIDQTKIILDEYLSNNDRLSVFIYSNQYKILCPLLYKSQIDKNSFNYDLINYKKIIFKESEEQDTDSISDYDINEIDEKELQNIQKTGFQFNQGINKNFSDSQKSFNDENKNLSISDIIKGLFDTINYAKKYIRVKQGIQNEKYFIVFTDLFNYYKAKDEIISNNLENLKEDKEIIFLLIGKNKLNYSLKENNNISLLEKENEKQLREILIYKYDKRSDIIYYENMKQIKNILSNIVIKDNIIYPNEIYK